MYVLSSLLLILATTAVIWAAVQPITVQPIIISADMAANGPATDRGFTALNDIVITEGDAKDFRSGSFTLTAPSGWQFNPAGTITAIPNNSNVTIGTITRNATSIVVNFTIVNPNQGGFDQITIRGVEVQALNGNVLSSNSEVILSSSLSGIGLPAPVARLSQVHGSARKLAFGQQPSTTGVYNTISPAVTVLVQDFFGHTVTGGASASSDITLAIGANPGGGVLAGSRTVAGNNGLATFSNLSIDAFGSNYTLVASSGTLTPATSSAFSITSTTPVLDEVVTTGCYTIGAPEQTITLRGSNFARNSVGRVGNSNRPTIYVSPNELRMILLASDMAVAGNKAINVLNLNPTAVSASHIVVVHHTIQTASITGAPSLSGDAPVSVCSGTTRSFTAPSDFTDYVWTVGTGATVPSENINSNILNVSFDIEAPASGKVSFKVAATNPCGVRLTRSFEIEIRQTPPDQITNDTPLIFCEGGSVILKAPEAAAGETPYTYQWRLAGVPIEGEVAMASTYRAEVPGSYSVIVTAKNGCPNTSTPVTVSTTSPLTQGAITGGTAYCQLATVASADALTATVGGGIDDNGTTIRTKTYKWEQSASASGPWVDAIGTNTSATYTPSTAEAGTMYYRRTVYAGGCESAPTAPIAVKVTPTINNEITAPTPVVCSGVAIEPLVGTLSGGDLNDVTYLWEQSASTSGPWVPADSEGGRPNNEASYSPTTETVTTSKTTYYRRKVSSGSCLDKTSNTVSVRITARPVATITQGTNTYFCPPGTATLTATSVSGATYEWFKVGEAGEKLPVENGNARTVSVKEAGEYFVEVTSNNCLSTSANILVQETVVGNNIINSQDQTVCYNEVPLTLKGSNATSTLGTVTYQWQRRTTATGSFSSITDETGIDLELTAHTADRWYRRLATVGSCTVISDTIHIAVKPELKVTNIPTSPIPVCTNTLFQFDPVGSVDGATFTWARAAVEGISNAPVTNGGGGINETLVNTTNAPIDVTYIYTTSGNVNCTGESQNLVVRVNPTPQLSSMLTPDAICSGGTFAYTARNTVAGSTKYDWVRAEAEGITTTAPASGTATSSTGASISHILTNTTANPINVKYTFTLTTNGCAGPPQDVVVTVNPRPQLSSTLTPDAVCSGTAFTYTPQSATAGATFTWTRAAVTGISNTAVTTPTAVEGSINETLINTTATPKVVTYRITSTANSCFNTAESVQVTVNPSPVLNSALTASVCSGATFNYSPTSATADASFSWRRVASAGNAAANGDGAISEVLTNTTNLPITVTYEITASANDCEGEPQNLVVTINPLPALSSPMTTTVCSGSPLAYTATSTVAGSTRYDWVREAVTGITTTAAVSGTTTSSTGANITHTLTNNTANPINVKYTFTLTTNGCAGPPQDVVVTVNPRPQLSSTLTPDAVCSGTAFTYTPQSATAGATFTWTRAAVTGISNAAVTEPVAGGINETLINTGTAPVTVTYKYTTTYASNGSSCPGSVQDVKVVVNPSPRLSNIPSSASVCSESPFNYNPTSATAGATFSWTRAAVPGISNDAVTIPVAGGVSETLVNTTANAIDVTYVFTTAANGCSGAPQNVVVRVNPNLPISFTGTIASSSEFLSGQGPVALSGSPTGGAFSSATSGAITASGGVYYFNPCAAGVGTHIIRYTRTTGTCTSVIEKTVTVTQSTYRTIITTDPFPFCRGGGGTTYTTAVYRDVQPGEIIYPYLTNASGEPVDRSGKPIPVGAGNYPIPNDEYPFPANTPESIKAMAFRFFQPIVSASLKNSDRLVPVTSFDYQWNKNDKVDNKENSYTVSDASLSSQDYYTVKVSSKNTGVCPSVTDLQSNRIYSATLDGYAITLSATPTTICQGGTVTFTATLGPNFPWSASKLQMDFVLERGNRVLYSTGYAGSNTVTFTTDAAAAGGFQNGDRVSINFRTDIISWLPANNCINAPISNPITITVQQPAAITAELASPTARCVGNNVTLTVAATGTNVQYAWYKAGRATPLTNSTGKISGATTNALTIANLAMADAGNYYVVVSNPTTSACSTPPVTSNQATLVVQQQPTAELVAPVTSKCAEGATTTFSLSGTTNYPPTWRVLSGPGEVNSTGVVTVTGTGTVRVQLTSANPSATGCTPATREVSLTVFPQPAATASVEGNATQCSNTDNPTTYTVKGIYVGTVANWVLPSGSPFVIESQSVANGVATAIVRATGTGTATMTLNALNPAAGCNAASYAITLTANPLPLARTLNEPSYCSLASPQGAEILLSNPESGVTYELRSGSQSLGTFTGTGGTLSLGTRPAGNYTVVGINNSNNAGCINPEVGLVKVTDTRSTTDPAGDMTHEWAGANKWRLTAVPETVKPFVAIPAGTKYNWYVKKPGIDDDFVLYLGNATETIVVENLPPDTEIVARVALTDGMCQQIQFVPGIPVPLPVELIYFNAMKRGNEVALDWATASEQDNKGFDVQFSTDGKNFRSLGFVASSVGTTSMKQLYTFVDKENGKYGTRYYRLKQEDFDGSFEYSATKAVQFGAVLANKVKAYPNPFHSEIELSIDAEVDGKVLVTVTNATGQQLLQRTIQVEKGANIEKLTLDPNLPRGIYIISTQIGEFNNHFKLLKQ